MPVEHERGLLDTDVMILRRRVDPTRPTVPHGR